MTLHTAESIGGAVCGDEILQLEPVMRIWIILSPLGLLLVSSAWSVGGPEGKGRWQDPGRANACRLRIEPSFFLMCVVDRGYIAQRMMMAVPWADLLLGYMRWLRGLLD